MAPIAANNVRPHALKGSTGPIKPPELQQVKGRDHLKRAYTAAGGAIKKPKTSHADTELRRFVAVPRPRHRATPAHCERPRTSGAATAWPGDERIVPQSVIGSAQADRRRIEAPEARPSVIAARSTCDDHTFLTHAAMLGTRGRSIGDPAVRLTELWSTAIHRAGRGSSRSNSRAGSCQNTSR